MSNSAPGNVSVSVASYHTYCESLTQPAPKHRPGHSPGRRCRGRRSVSLRAAAQTTRRGLGARKRLSPPAPPVVYHCCSLSPDESKKKKHACSSIRASRFTGAVIVRLGGSCRRLLRRFGRAPGGRARVRFWPQSEVRAAVRTRRDLHPQQHMLLLPGLRGRDLPVWWCHKTFLLNAFSV